VPSFEIKISAPVPHPTCIFFKFKRKNVMRLAIFSFKTTLASSVNGEIKKEVL